MAPTITDARAKIARLDARLKEAKDVISNEARTIRLVSTNIQLLERGVQRVEAYAEFEVDEEGQFDYDNEAQPLVEEAEDLIIYLKGFQNELEKAAAAATNPTSSKPTEPQRHGANNIRVTIPIFDGAYNEYPKFRAAFTTAMEADQKSKPAQLRVLEQHLKGRPLTLITNLPPTDAGFEEAIKILDETFDVKERQRDALLHAIRKMPRAGDDLNSTRDNYENLESLLRALQNYENVNTNDELRRLVMSKYSINTINQVSPTEVPSLQVLRDKIKHLIRTREDIHSVFSSLSTSPPELRSIPIASYAARSECATKTPKATTNISPSYVTPAKRVDPHACRYCQKNGHTSEDCRTYATAKDRVGQLPKFTCHRCLEKGHTRRNCKNFEKCAICESVWHHTSLCHQKFGYFRDSPRTRPEEKKTDNVTPAANKEEVKTTVALANRTKQCYLTASIQIRNPKTNATSTVRIFGDCGSGRSFILQRMAHELQLKQVDRSKLAIQVFMRSEIEEIDSDVVQLELLDPRTGEPHLISAHTVPRITDKIVSLNARDFVSKYPQLASLDLADESNDEEIVILLGNDFLWTFILPEQKIELDKNLYVLNTMFGWMVVGNHQEQFDGTQMVNSFHISTNSLTALWSLDAIGISEKNLSTTEEEEIALQQFNETIRYVPEERRYEVSLPCRTLRPEVPTNFVLAKAILFSLIRRNRNHPEYLEACGKIFDEQLQAGIIEPALEYTENSHYIPYKWIIRPGKSTPIRIVYNASAKSSKQQQSLNETLYKGVNLLGDALGILIRFRLHPVAITADIAKAFHQITLVPHCRDYLRFLWVKDPANEESNELVTYRFRRLPFGVISSPFILAATILHHLNRYANEETNRIRRDIYADNIITSFSTQTEAARFCTKAQEIFDQAGMPLRQWQSNSPHIIDQIPDDHRDKNDVITVLGLTWETKNDLLRINIPVVSEEKVTMLNVLQTSAKFYDPLGLFAPITITSRMFLQTLHARGYDWGTKLNEQETEQWSEIRRQHLAIERFQFRRSFTDANTEIRSLQLHVFSDASAKAYGAAAYLRIESNQRITVHLLIAKSRVTPLKGENQLTIPRLELMGALLGSRIMTNLTRILTDEHVEQKTLWIDSKCVLSWLHTNAAVPRFVKNRVTEIKNSPDVTYRYVPSADNPADLASRGVTAEDLQDPRSNWWHGPEWLADTPDRWPPVEKFAAQRDISPEPVMQIIEKLSTQVDVIPEHVLSVPEITKVEPVLNIDPNKYNDFTKLIRVTAIVIQFLRSFKVIKKKRLFSTKLTSVELATLRWFLYVQRSNFADTYELLQQNKSSHFIKKFQLFLHDDGLLRLKGRFQHANLTFHEKHPILLPKASNNVVVKLLVVEIHRRKLHASVNATLAELRRKYWLLQGRKQVTAALRFCYACKREKARCYAQPTDSILPTYRLDDTAQPFSHVGIDVAGHFWIRNAKKWILLVTCLVTRAILLEDLDNMETETILLALERAESQTKGFTTYVSDNAPQFQLIQNILQSSRTSPIEWKFLPAHMPWAGGAYERLVKIVKSSLYATLRDEVYVNEVQFRTILKKLANMLNDRPLTYLSEQFDGQPLTPNDFLRRNFLPSELDLDKKPSDSATAAFLKHQLKQSDQIITSFWNKWSREYLQFLRERFEPNKFRKNTHQREPRIGDVVLLEDDVRKRRLWHLAEVVQLQRSEDNRVRAAVVRLASKTKEGMKITKVIRPVEKIFFLELNTFEDQGDPIPTAGDGPDFTL